MLQRFLAVLTFCVLAYGGMGVSPARAQSVTYHILMDTSGLAASLIAPVSLDFQFDDGGTPGNNTATLSGFTFGGGSASASPSSLLGGATGNVNATVAINDTLLVNELVQDFAPGQLLAFDLSLTTNPDTALGGSPDEFSLALLDSSGNEIATTAGNNAFVTIDVDSSNPTVTTAGNACGRGVRHCRAPGSRRLCAGGRGIRLAREPDGFACCGHSPAPPRFIGTVAARKQNGPPVSF